MKFTDAWEAHRRLFLESLRVRGQSPATLNARSQSLSTFFLWLCEAGIEDVREVTRDHIRAYQMWLIKSPRGIALTTNSVHAKLIGLRRFFEHLEASDTVLLNPCVGLILPKFEDRLPRGVLTQAEARRVLNAPDTQTKKGIRDRAILELFYATGIRVEEMAALTIHDVDCKNGFVRVTKGKFAKDRVVPMGATASDCVTEYLKHVRLPWIKAAQQREVEQRPCGVAPLWLSSYLPHGPMKKQAIAAMAGDYKKLAGVTCPGATHLWRHSCATHLVQNGANLAYVQRLLGHRSLDTTAIYTRVSAAEVADTVRRKHPRSRVVRRRTGGVQA